LAAIDCAHANKKYILIYKPVIASVDQSSPELPQSRLKSHHAILASLFISTIVAGAGVYMYQVEQSNQLQKDLQAKISELEAELRTVKKKDVSVPYAQLPSTPTPQTRSDQGTNTSLSVTSGWKIYTNTDYSFTLKYPSDLTQEDTPNSSTFRAQGTDSFSITVKDHTFAKNTIQGLYGRVEEHYLTSVRIGEHQGYAYSTGDAGRVGTAYVLGTTGNTKTIETTFISCEGDKSLVEPNEQSIISSFQFIP
jgi:hypothetical protein